MLSRPLRCIPRSLRFWRTTTRGACAVAALGAGALLVGACGGDDSESAQESDASVEEQLGFDDEGIQTRQLEVEERIRECMEAQGFEYIPVDPAAQQATLLGSADLSDEEFIEQYGYGIATLYERRLQQVGDPNVQIREQLLPADLAAYDSALRGDNTDATFFSAMDTGDFTKLGGCTREATEAVFGGAESLQTLQEKVDELDQQVTNDARMVEARQRWSDCIREAGFSFGTNPDDIDLYLQDKLTALVGEGSTSPQGSPLASPGDTTTGTAPVDGTPAAPGYDPASLTALQQEELDIAKADFACEEEEIAPVEEEVQVEYDQAFREQNGELIQRVER